MNRFEFAQPESLSAAIALLGSSYGEAEVLAGGTDLLSLMKDFIVEPKRVVSLAKVPELRGITVEKNGISIGAMTTLDELLASKEIAIAAPALTQAAEGIRSPQLRAMGSVGGELLQRPRCWYFRRGHGLLGQKDGKSMVEAGDNRYHAILGNKGAAKFVSASSLGPALVALNASVEIVGKDGGRWAEVRDLYRTPQADGEREHAVASNEILRQIHVPTPATASATYEVRHRHGLDWPEVGASVSLVLEDGKVKDCGACLGHVAPTPWIVTEGVRKILAGHAIDETLANAAAANCLSDVAPLSGNGYKVELARVALKRALLKAFGTPV